MSVAIPARTPTPSSLATRPNMLPKSSSSAPRIQSRPAHSASASGPSIQSRPMAPRPSAAAASSTSQSQLASRPSINNNTSSSITARVPIPRPSANPSAAFNVNHNANIGASATANAKASGSSPAAGPPHVSRTSSQVSTPASSSTTAAPSGSSNGKDTSSSAGKIFAKPSKEWVLPERAKPGRKVSVEEPDNKRQSQNRLSQRAHRARRTDYIQTLEERLRQYEADEIHSNVRLQEVARALKADNERLKAEANALRTKCMEYNGEKDVWELERRGMRDILRDLRREVEALRAGRGMETIVRMELDQNTIDSLVPGPSPSLNRRPSLTVQHQHQSQQQQQTMSGVVSAQGMGAQRDLVDCPICPNPDPDCPCQQGASSSSAQQSASRQDFTLATQTSSSVSGCGLCHSTDECLCRAVIEEDIKPDISSAQISSPAKSFRSMLDDGCGLCAGGGFCACRAASDPPSNSSGSVTIKAVSLPTISSTATSGVVRATGTAAAMPLRLRVKSSNSGVVKPSIWQIDNVPAAISPKSNEAVCTGDPSNCDACRDDSFGREFCQNLFEEGEGDAPTGEIKPCTNCSGNCVSIKSLLSPSASSGPDQKASSASTSTATSAGASTRIVTPPYPSTTHDLISLTGDEDIAPLAPLQMACCGNPGLCGGHSGIGCTGEVVALSGSPVHSHSHSHSRSPSNSISGPGPVLDSSMSFDKPMVRMNMVPRSHSHDDHTTLRPDQAWKQLKAHPNAKFASLALLADVVARRTTVLNPTMSPTAASPSPMPSSPALSATGVAGGIGSDATTTAHGASYGVTSRSSLGSTSTLPINATSSASSGGGRTGAGGKKRNFELETSAVRDALKLLDRATPTGSPVPSTREELELDRKSGSKRRRMGV